MKTIILHSKSLNNFLVFETNKAESELIEHLKGLNFIDEQALFKELVFSSDLESEIYSNHTYESNKDTERFAAICKKENEGATYIGANRGAEGKKIIQQKSAELSNNVSGISGMSSLFLGICQLIFWVIIIASGFIGLTMNVISGISIAVGAVIGFGLIFILGDLLKNTVEINKKLNNSNFNDL